MCSLTIDCRCATGIDGITRYQCPRSSPCRRRRETAELRKLAIVRPCVVSGRPTRLDSLATRANQPGDAGRADDAGRMRASAARPSPSTQHRSFAQHSGRPAIRRHAPASSVGRKREGERDQHGRQPAVEAKELHARSRETKASVKTMPRPRWKEKRNRISAVAC
jgi:hypothetical protein